MTHHIVSGIANEDCLRGENLAPRFPYPAPRFIFPNGRPLFQHPHTLVSSTGRITIKAFSSFDFTMFSRRETSNRVTTQNRTSCSVEYNRRWL